MTRPRRDARYELPTPHRCGGAARRAARQGAKWAPSQSCVPPFACARAGKMLTRVARLATRGRHWVTHGRGGASTSSAGAPRCVWAGLASCSWVGGLRAEQPHRARAGRSGATEEAELALKRAQREVLLAEAAAKRADAEATQLRAKTDTEATQKRADADVKRADAEVARASAESRRRASLEWGGVLLRLAGATYLCADWVQHEHEPFIQASVLRYLRGCRGAVRGTKVPALTLPVPDRPAPSSPPLMLVRAAARTVRPAGPPL